MSDNGNPPQIYALLSKVMADIGAVGKTQTNTQQRYQFRGIDDVYNAVQPALIKHGIVPVPLARNHTVSATSTSTGKHATHAMLSLQVEFFAPDGSSVIAETVGEGLDMSDKASNKAMSAAYKYALFQVFCIPTAEAKDSERDSIERGAPASPAPPGTPPPPANRLTGTELIRWVDQWRGNHGSSLDGHQYTSSIVLAEFPEHVPGTTLTEGQLLTVKACLQSGKYDKITGNPIPTEAAPAA